MQLAIPRLNTLKVEEKKKKRLTHLDLQLANDMNYLQKVQAFHPALLQ